MVGITQPAVSAMVADGRLQVEGLSLGDALQAYCQRLRDQAAGRVGSEVGGLDLVQERAALAREQREGQAIKNAVARREYAPIGLLADVLGRAGGAVVDRFDRRCLDLNLARVPHGCAPFSAASAARWVSRAS